MLSRFGYFVSKRALYLATGWLFLFAMQLLVASCTPEPVAGFAVRITSETAHAKSVTS
ncbi:MAG: hypothetical protein QM667_11105 [Asticcacaulis sp.]